MSNEYAFPAVIALELIVSLWVLRSVTRLLLTTIQNEKLSLEYVSKFVEFRKLLLDDETIDKTLTQKVDNLLTTFFEGDYVNDEEYLYGRIDYRQPALAAYFRCVIYGLFARSYQDIKNGPLIRSQLAKRMLVDFPAFEILDVPIDAAGQVQAKISSP